MNRNNRCCRPLGERCWRNDIDNWLETNVYPSEDIQLLANNNGRCCEDPCCCCRGLRGLRSGIDPRGQKGERGDRDEDTRPATTEFFQVYDSAAPIITHSGDYIFQEAYVLKGGDAISYERKNGEFIIREPGIYELDVSLNVVLPDERPFRFEAELVRLKGCHRQKLMSKCIDLLGKENDVVFNLPLGMEVISQLQCGDHIALHFNKTTCGAVRLSETVVILKKIANY